MKANIAESKDINYTIQLLKVIKDKQKDTYAEHKIVPSINRMILELEAMEGSEIWISNQYHLMVNSSIYAVLTSRITFNAL